MKKLLTLAAAAVLFTGTTAQAAVQIGGYIDAGYQDVEGDMNRGTVQASTSMNGFADADAQFNVNEVNLDIWADLTDRFRVFTSWDATNQNGYGLTADYAYIEWANPAGFDVNVRLGIIPSVVGIEQRVAESNQNAFANLSLASPYTVGSLEGISLSGTWSPINWAVAYTNDDPLGVARVTGTLADVLNPTNASATTGADDESARNIEGRLGVVPLEGLEVGVSAWQSRLNAAGTNPKVEREGVGVDLSYTYGALNLGGEFYRIEEENTTANTPDDEIKVWYVFATYDVTDALTLGARYSENEIDVAGSTKDHDANTISLLANYALTRDVTVKFQYDINDEDALEGPITDTNREADNDAFMLSVVASF